MERRNVVRTDWLKVLVLRLLALIAFFGAWLYLKGPGDVSPIILPELGAVWTELVAFLKSPEVYEATAVTAGSILLALFISGVSGLLVGFWAARSELRASVLERLLVWGYLVPTVLFYPLLLLWLGFGISSKVAYATLNAFLPIAFNSLRGYRRVDLKYINVGRAFGASPRQLDWSIKLQAALPLTRAGLKIGAALCMITVIVGEMLGSSRGLGYLIQLYAGSFNTARTYAIIVVVFMLVWVFQFLVNRIWRDETPTTDR